MLYWVRLSNLFEVFDLAEIALPEPEFRVSPDRMAWRVVITFFALFCVFVVLTLTISYYFLFESTISVETVVRVGRGTAGITETNLIERSVRSSYRLTSRNVTVRTDSQSQSTISFYDQQNNTENLVATVTLRGETTLTIRNASTPRFEWSNANYSIELREFSGELDILVGETVETGLEFIIVDDQGIETQIIDPGHYQLQSSLEQFSLTNFEGTAAIFTEENAQPHLIAVGERGDLLTDLGSIITSPIRRNLVHNADFEIVSTEALVPEGWWCTDTQDAPPSGVYATEMRDGRSAIRLTRNQEARNHGETGCWQPIGEENFPLDDYSYLSINATFLVNFQSLTQCGVDGSECPMMLQLDYLDSNGNPQKWFQGFYYNDELRFDYPGRCSTCVQDHQRINEKAWYTFESENLLRVIPAELRPEIITGIAFYAKGHEYDVSVNRVELQVGLADVAVTDSTTDEN